MTPGSGAAAAAALGSGIHYEGLCTNGAHKQCLDGLMDIAIYAIATESDEAAAAVGATKEHVANARLFFASTLKQAKRFVTAETADEDTLEEKEEDSSEDDN